MAPVNGKPFLERLVTKLSGQGITDFVFCVGYRKELIMGHFGDGSNLNVRIRYATEEEPLGTGGAVLNARPFLDGTFLLLNGDTYLDLDYPAFLEFHSNHVSMRNCVGSIALVQSPSGEAYGSVTLDFNQRVLSFSEKTSESLEPGWINGGVYLFEPGIDRFLSVAGPSSLERDVIPAVLSSDSALYGFPSEGAFVDIGTREGYRKIQKIDL
jgi:NDP-sugar pyrophosphorylase family protein